MSETLDLCANYKLIRDRLRNPPNAVIDKGINLRRILIPPEEPILEEVSEHQVPICTVTVVEIPRPRPKPLTIRAILRAVMDHYKVSLIDIRGARRSNDIVRPRHVVCYLATTYTGLSYPAVAKHIGGRDHTTIMHAVRKMKERLLVEEELVNTIKILEDRLFAGDYDDQPNQHRSAVAAISESSVAE